MEVEDECATMSRDVRLRHCVLIGPPGTFTTGPMLGIPQSCPDDKASRIRRCGPSTLIAHSHLEDEVGDVAEQQDDCSAPAHVENEVR